MPTTEQRTRRESNGRHGARIAVAGLFALVTLPAAGLVGWSLWSGTPLVMDEWECAQGEVPADHAEGGSACFGAEEELGAGWTAHPLGNRPHACEGRRGWTQVWSSDPQWTGELEVVVDCADSDRALPPGWSAVPEGYEAGDHLPPRSTEELPPIITW